MSYGKDERHIDKYVWQLPIAEYDPEDQLHTDIARFGALLEKEVTALELDPKKGFVWQRQQVRQYLSTSAAGKELGLAVRKILA